MFVRSTKNKEGRIYLQVAENYRDKGKIKQRILCTLGRLDILRQDGQIESLIRSAARFSEKLAIIEACKEAAKTQKANTIKIGPALVFEKLWKKTGIKEAIEILLNGREFKFSIERAIFVTVLHRLFCSGSDRAAEKWKERYKIEGAEQIELHQLYRAMGWIGEGIPALGGAEESVRKISRRCIKDRIEEEIFRRRRDLFSSCELVFFDTTSIYFEGEGGEEIGVYGKSKDHRPDLRQMVVGVVLDNKGHPICCELWQGNTTDVKTLLPVVERLQQRFGIRRICIVADRGMISKKTIKELESGNYEAEYILGARMRAQKEVRENVLTQAGEFEEIFPERKKNNDPSPLKVKEVEINEHRYIVCINEEQARKDKADREAIILSLKEKLKKGDKRLIGNKGYRRYLKTEGSCFSIDEERIKKESLYDGKWVLRTNTQLPAKEAALKYKQLWMVEDIFRSMKSILETRPIYHKCDETIRGHVFCSFLALILRKELQDRIQEKGWLNMEWQDVINDLDELHEIEETFSGKKFILREECRGVAGKVIQAAGAALPPTIREA